MADIRIACASNRTLIVYIGKKCTAHEIDDPFDAKKKNGFPNGKIWEVIKVFEKKFCRDSLLDQIC